MSQARSEDDALLRWLTPDVVAALDAITGEAVDVIGVVDRGLTIRFINWATGGLTRERVVGTSVVDLMPPDYREIARDAYTNALKTAGGTRFETMYKDGDEVHLWDVRVGPIRSEGDVIGLIAVASNVTEQRRAQADRDRFFSLSLDMLVVVRPDGHLKRANPAFGETLGYELYDLIGTPFINLVHPDDRGRTLEAFERCLRGARVTDFENQYRRRDGEYRVFSWRATVDPVTGDVYAVARDITDQRATEAQLRHAQKMEAVGQLAGGVAHDFNNLLLAILGNTEVASQSTLLSAELAEHLGEIKAAAQRAADLTKQLLAFSRRQPLHAVPVDLNELTRGLMTMLRRLLPESITIDWIPGTDIPSVDADPSQLEQIIVNLCVNARDAMEQGGRLKIETENVVLDGGYCDTHPWAKPGRYVLLRVTDTGTGMVAAVLERAFEPFFTTKGPHRGTGLGLSTVYGIVQQHEGLIQVHSEAGLGTTFEIYLPAGVPPQTSVGDEIQAMPRRGQETILLVEDEARVRDVVAQLLELAGYHVVRAVNGVEAIRVLREYEGAIHLVLLDVIMPELGGPETWERMRGLREGLRVLFTSGYADEECRKRLPPGAEVLQKPFASKELMSRIRKKLDG